MRARSNRRARPRTAPAFRPSCRPPRAVARLARPGPPRGRGARCGRRSASRRMSSFVARCSSWLEGLGESARAAAALKPIAAMPDLDSAEAAYLMVRAGLLKARAGAPAAAAVSFETAMSIDPSDPLRGRAPRRDVDLRSRRRRARGRLRVPTARPPAASGSSDARTPSSRIYGVRWPWTRRARRRAAALADLLEGQGRAGAADEVRTGLRRRRRRRSIRARARSLARSGWRPRWRRTTCRVRSARPSTAGFDARLRGRTPTPSTRSCSTSGLLETVASRLEVRCERDGEAGDLARQAAHLVELARLCAGPLADPTAPWAPGYSALAANPSCEDALVALRSFARRGGRALGVSLGVRGDPMRALASTLAAIEGARERRATLIAELGRVLTSLGAEPPLARRRHRFARLHGAGVGAGGGGAGARRDRPGPSSGSACR